jgi:hypothetical protein
VTPSPSFFRYNLDGSQGMAGLGSYIFNEKKYKKIVTLAADGLRRALLAHDSARENETLGYGRHGL